MQAESGIEKDEQEEAERAAKKEKGGTEESSSRYIPTSEGLSQASQSHVSQKGASQSHTQGSFVHIVRQDVKET